MKSINDLAKAICKKEKGKKEIDIAQVKEILGVLSDMIYAQFERNGILVDLDAKNYIDIILYKNGCKRAKKKAGKK